MKNSICFFNKSSIETSEALVIFVKVSMVGFGFSPDSILTIVS